MAFVDRELELALLSDVARRGSSQLVVLYGRRRIGKTELITHWLRHHVPEDSVYWVAHRSSAAMLLEKFSRALQPQDERG